MTDTHTPSADIADELEIAVKALLDVKRHTQDQTGSRTRLAFVTARDALIRLGRNPDPGRRVQKSEEA